MTFADDLPELMLAEEVAKVLRMHPASVRKMCRAGTLECTKLAGKWLVPKSEVKRLLTVHLAGGRELPRENIWKATDQTSHSEREDDDEHSRRAAVRPGPARGDAPSLLQARIIG